MLTRHSNLVCLGFGVICGVVIATALTSRAQAPDAVAKAQDLERGDYLDIPRLLDDLKSQDRLRESKALGELFQLHRQISQASLAITPRRLDNPKRPARVVGPHPGKLVAKYYTSATPRYLSRCVEDFDAEGDRDQKTRLNGYPCAQALVDLGVGALDGILGVLSEKDFEPNDQAFQLYVQVVRFAYRKPYLGGTRGAIAAVEVARDWARDKKKDPHLTARYQRLLDGLKKHLEFDEKFNPV